MTRSCASSNAAVRCSFLHNRVETIDRLALKLTDLIPEAKIAVAHGQMRPKELEKVMVDFLDNKTQVLVCSAIIESGLDFPNANTIIINRADKFGLAQLYQLRGRVGRSHRHAYAYLLIPGEKAITPDAEKRLRALQEIDGLGGGFKLALHDLEIRGAGNLLGDQQSGQITAVGFELYTEMMEKAIQELKGEEVLPEVDPEIRLGISAYFPDNYIPGRQSAALFLQASGESAQQPGAGRIERRDQGSLRAVRHCRRESFSGDEPAAHAERIPGSADQRLGWQSVSCCFIPNRRSRSKNF